MTQLAKLLNRYKKNHILRSVCCAATVKFHPIYSLYGSTAPHTKATVAYVPAMPRLELRETQSSTISYTKQNTRSIQKFAYYGMKMETIRFLRYEVKVDRRAAKHVVSAEFEWNGSFGSSLLTADSRIYYVISCGFEYISNAMTRCGGMSGLCPGLRKIILRSRFISYAMCAILINWLTILCIFLLMH